ncbi:MAG: helix-turn-helix domain-containing protein [Caulobacteraceae bacterium]
MNNDGGPSLSAIFAQALGASGRGMSLSRFSNDGLASHEQFNAFSDWFGSFLNVTPTHEIRQGFSFSHCSIGFENMSLVNYRRDGSLSERNAKHIRAEAVDMLAIITLREGVVSGQTPDRDYDLRPGEVLLRETARPLRALSEGTDVVVLSVPRERISRMIGDVSAVTGHVFRGGVMGVLRDYMCSLVDHADDLQSASASEIGGVTEKMITAALAPSRDAFLQAEAPIADLIKSRALKYISHNLFSPELTPDRIAVAVGVSRRKLYQIFESEGGIARYVVGLRLERARSALAGEYRSGMIKEVAFTHGFQSEAHFSRSFKARFSHSPSETRDVGKALQLVG